MNVKKLNWTWEFLWTIMQNLFIIFCQSCLNVNPDSRVKHIGTEHRLVVQCLADKELVKNAKESNKYNNVQVSLSRDYQTSFGCPESTILN